MNEDRFDKTYAAVLARRARPESLLEFIDIDRKPVSKEEVVATSEDVIAKFARKGNKR